MCASFQDRAFRIADRTGGRQLNTLTFSQALAARRSHRAFTDEAVPQDIVHRLLWAAQGATDDAGNLTAPSAHGLHPLRLYVSAGNVQDVAPGVYRADLENRSLVPHVARDVRTELEHAALTEQPWVGEASGIISVCSDLAAPAEAFVDQAPFGLRGLRYVHIEAGAAAQNIYLQAAVEGLGCVLVAGFKDEATAAILGLEPPVEPVLHMCFGWPAEA